MPNIDAQPPHSGYMQTFRCTDTHQQAAVLRAWNQSYCQLSAGAFAGSVTEIDTGAVRVIVERLNRTLLQRGALPADCIAIGVPLQLQGHARLCGYTSHLNGLHVFSGADGFEFLSPEQHLVVDIEFYPQSFANERLREALAHIAAQLGRRATVLDFPAPAMDALRNTLRNMLQVTATHPQLLDNTPVREAFEKSLIFALADLLEQAPAPDLPHHKSAPRSWQLAQAARTTIDQAAHDCPLSVAELVTTLNVSRRNLQYAFQDALGVNPASYLRNERLNRVRCALGEAQSVTEAATRLGFWHFGHFATKYRTLFGELPSDTFRRHKTTQVATPAQVIAYAPGDWLK